MIKCGICGKEFNDNQIDEYKKHVDCCLRDYVHQNRKEDIENLIEQINIAKDLYLTNYKKYQNLLIELNKNYPEEYIKFIREEYVNLFKKDPVKINDVKVYDLEKMTSKDIESLGKSFLDMIYSKPSFFKN